MVNKPQKESQLDYLLLDQVQLVVQYRQFYNFPRPRFAFVILVAQKVLAAPVFGLDCKNKVAQQ